MQVCIAGVLQAQELEHLRQWAAAAPWATQQSAGEMARLVKHNLQIPETAEGLLEMRRIVLRALNRDPEVIAAALPYKVVPPNFNRYTPEHSHYGAHTDNTLRWMPDGSCVRTDVSATLFLSDPDEYDGGELEIEALDGPRQVKLAAGDLVLYPSGAVHQVRPVTRGARLACYLFLQSVVPDTECRRELYALDRCLRALRARLGDADPELVQLNATYHNLLRRWSQC